MNTAGTGQFGLRTQSSSLKSITKQDELSNKTIVCDFFLIQGFNTIPYESHWILEFSFIPMIFNEYLTSFIDCVYNKVWQTIKKYVTSD